MRRLRPPVSNTPPIGVNTGTILAQPASIAAMDEHEMRSRVAEARVARLATINLDGNPRIVPVCFAFRSDEIVTAVDGKPKSTRMLARLGNVVANSVVSLLVDHYDDDWTQLWWVRVDGKANISEISAGHIDALAAKYEQYRHDPPAGPVIVIRSLRFIGWSYR
jgi:PPOX class probable F420-dependent enzyme